MRRSYLHQAIIEAIGEAGEPVMAKEIRDPVSEKMGIPLSSIKIGAHLRVICDGGEVRKKVFQKGYTFYWIP